MPKRLGLIVAMSCVLALKPVGALALDLGLTPSQVYSIWVNINDALFACARVVSDDDAWHQSLVSMEPRRVYWKRPADVLKRVAAFRHRLDSLRRQSGRPPTRQMTPRLAEITPSVVFLHSGHVRDRLVEWLIENTGPEQLVSQFYVRHVYVGKSPSHVFGLVDLATRRIDEILDRIGL